jgi:hypothetical protein
MFAALYNLASVPFAAPAAPGNPLVPNPAPVPIPGMENIANDFLGWLKWGGIIVGVAGLIICGIMMIAGRRNRSSMAADGASGLAWVIGGLSIVSFGASLVSFVFAA